MLPRSYYYVARHRARFHLQVRVESVESGIRTPGFADVEAVVERVFRGGNAVDVGDRIRFGIAVTRPGDELPASGVVWKPYDQVSNSAYVEVFLDGTPPELTVALSNCELLINLTERPTMRGSYPLLALRMAVDKKRAQHGPFRG